MFVYVNAVVYYTHNQVKPKHQMLYAIQTITEEGHNLRFIKCEKSVALLTFESQLETLRNDGGEFIISLVDEDELINSGMYLVSEAGRTTLEFESTVVYDRYVDDSMSMDETDYMQHR